MIRLFERDLLPENTTIFGYARTKMDQKEFHDRIAPNLKTQKEDTKQKFLDICRYVPGAYDEAEAFQNLNKEIEEVEKKRGGDGCNRIFYLALPPNVFASVSEQLKKNCYAESGVNRVVIEKPFGHDLASAQELNAVIERVFPSDAVFRIDHYLGKETVQNILALRFANQIFEPMWNAHYIDHIQITVDEKLGVGHRGSFYDATGALRDMVPNHLFQLLSLVALFYVSVAVFVLGVLGAVMALAGINILKFLGYLREELMIVVATASSDAVLPQVMRKLERFWSSSLDYSGYPVTSAA